MKTKEEYKISIEQYPLEKSHRSHSTTRQLTGEFKDNGRTIITLNGTRQDGRSIVFRDIGQSLRNDIDSYPEGSSPITFKIRIDVTGKQAIFSSTPYVKPEPVKVPAVIRTPTLYGHTLAQAVATGYLPETAAGLAGGK